MNERNDQLCTKKYPLRAKYGEDKIAKEFLVSITKTEKSNK